MTISSTSTPVFRGKKKGIKASQIIGIYISLAMRETEVALLPKLTFSLHGVKRPWQERETRKGDIVLTVLSLLWRWIRTATTFGHVTATEDVDVTNNKRRWISFLWTTRDCDKGPFWRAFVKFLAYPLQGFYPGVLLSVAWIVDSREWRLSNAETYIFTRSNRTRTRFVALPFSFTSQGTRTPLTLPRTFTDRFSRIPRSCNS